jgi:hypothetical protein
MVQWVWYAVAGQSWPETNEAELYRLAEHWQTLATALTEGRPGLTGGMTDLSAWYGGTTGQELVFTSYDVMDGLQQLTESALSRHMMVRQGAMDVEFTKYSMIMEALITAIAVLYAILSSYLTFGTSTASIPPLIGSGRAGVMRLAGELVRRLGSRGGTQGFRLLSREGARHVLREGAQEIAEEVTIVAGAGLLAGNGLDWDRMVHAGTAGFVGGVTGATMFGHNWFGFGNRFMRDQLREGGLGPFARRVRQAALQNPPTSALGGWVASGFEGGLPGLGGMFVDGAFGAALTGGTRAGLTLAGGSLGTRLNPVQVNPQTGLATLRHRGGVLNPGQLPASRLPAVQHILGQANLPEGATAVPSSNVFRGGSGNGQPSAAPTSPAELMTPGTNEQAQAWLPEIEQQVRGELDGLPLAGQHRLRVEFVVPAEGGTLVGMVVTDRAGDPVGSMTRMFSRDQDGTAYVEHISTVLVGESGTGQPAAVEFDPRAEQAYQRLGFTEVRLLPGVTDPAAAAAGHADFPPDAGPGLPRQVLDAAVDFGRTNRGQAMAEVVHGLGEEPGRASTATTELARIRLDQQVAGAERLQARMDQPGSPPPTAYEISQLGEVGAAGLRAVEWSGVKQLSAYQAVLPTVELGSEPAAAVERWLDRPDVHNAFSEPPVGIRPVDGQLQVVGASAGSPPGPVGPLEALAAMRVFTGDPRVEYLVGAGGQVVGRPSTPEQAMALLENVLAAGSGLTAAQLVQDIRAWARYQDAGVRQAVETRLGEAGSRPTPGELGALAAEIGPRTAPVSQALSLLQATAAAEQAAEAERRAVEAAHRYLESLLAAVSGSRPPPAPAGERPGPEVGAGSFTPAEAAPTADLDSPDPAPPARMLVGVGSPTTPRAVAEAADDAGSPTPDGPADPVPDGVPGEPDQQPGPPPVPEAGQAGGTAGPPAPPAPAGQPGAGHPLGDDFRGSPHTEAVIESYRRAESISELETLLAGALAEVGYGPGVTVSLAGMALETAREHAEAITRAALAFPHTPLSMVFVSEPLDGGESGLPFARSDHLGMISFDSNWAAPDRRQDYLTALEEDVDSGWLVSADPLYLAFHEFAHQLHNAVGEGVDAEIREVVRRRAADHGEPELVHVEEEVSGYAADTFRDDVSELVAEAFADVAVNGESASPLSLEVVAVLVAAYRDGPGPAAGQPAGPDPVPPGHPGPATAELPPPDDPSRPPLPSLADLIEIGDVRSVMAVLTSDAFAATVPSGHPTPRDEIAISYVIHDSQGDQWQVDVRLSRETGEFAWETSNTFHLSYSITGRGDLAKAAALGDRLHALLGGWADASAMRQTAASTTHGVEDLRVHLTYERTDVRERQVLKEGDEGKRVDLIVSRSGPPEVRISFPDIPTREHPPYHRRGAYEILMATVLRNFGLAATPEVTPAAPDTAAMPYVRMRFVEGERFDELDPERHRAILDSREMHLLAVSDLILGNLDREAQNLIVVPGGDDENTSDGDLAPIDHEHGFDYGGEPGKPPTRGMAGTVTRHHYDRYVLDHRDHRPPEWIDNPLAPADVEFFRRGLEQARPEFERLGSLDEYRAAMTRLDAIGRHAKGTVPLFAEHPTGEPHTAAGPESLPADRRHAARLYWQGQHLSEALAVAEDVLRMAEPYLRGMLTEAAGLAGAALPAEQVAALREVRQRLPELTRAVMDELAALHRRDPDGEPVYRLEEYQQRRAAREQLERAIAVASQAAPPVADLVTQIADLVRASVQNELATLYPAGAMPDPVDRADLALRGIARSIRDFLPGGLGDAEQQPAGGQAPDRRLLADLLDIDQRDAAAAQRLRWELANELDGRRFGDLTVHVRLTEDGVPTVNPVEHGYAIPLDLYDVSTGPVGEPLGGTTLVVGRTSGDPRYTDGTPYLAYHADPGLPAIDPREIPFIDDLHGYLTDLALESGLSHIEVTPADPGTLLLLARRGYNLAPRTPPEVGDRIVEELNHRRATLVEELSGPERQRAQEALAALDSVLARVVRSRPGWPGYPPLSQILAGTGVLTFEGTPLPLEYVLQAPDPLADEGARAALFDGGHHRADPQAVQVYRDAVDHDPVDAVLALARALAQSGSPTDHLATVTGDLADYQPAGNPHDAVARISRMLEQFRNIVEGTYLTGDELLVPPSHHPQYPAAVLLRAMTAELVTLLPDVGPVQDALRRYLDSILAAHHAPGGRLPELRTEQIRASEALDALTSGDLPAYALPRQLADLLYQTLQVHEDTARQLASAVRDGEDVSHATRRLARRKADAPTPVVEAANQARDRVRETLADIDGDDSGAGTPADPAGSPGQGPSGAQRPRSTGTSHPGGPVDDPASPSGNVDPGPDDGGRAIAVATPSSVVAALMPELARPIEAGGPSHRAGVPGAEFWASTGSNGDDPGAALGSARAEGPESEQPAVAAAGGRGDGDGGGGRPPTAEAAEPEPSEEGPDESDPRRRADDLLSATLTRLVRADKADAPLEFADDGAVHWTGSRGDGQLPAERMALLRQWLTDRYAKGVDPVRLRVEAWAVLGAELAGFGEARLSRVVGALNALATLVELGEGDRSGLPTGDEVLVRSLAQDIMAVAPLAGARPEGLSDRAEALAEAALAAPTAVPDPYRTLRPTDYRGEVEEATVGVEDLLQRLTDLPRPEIAAGARAARERIREVAELLRGATTALQHRSEVRRTAHEAATDLAAAARHERIASSYRAAAAKAQAARRAYHRVGELLEHIEATAESGHAPRRTRRQLAAALSRARKAYAAYERALLASQPAPEALHVGLPSGELPHVVALHTLVTYALREHHGVDLDLPPDALAYVVRSHWPGVASDEGEVLELGQPAPAEVRIRFIPDDPVEVTEPETTVVQLIIGHLPQGGSEVAATEQRSRGAEDMAPIHDAVNIPVTVEPARGRSSSRSVKGAGADYAVGGAVADNVGESTLYDLRGSWEVQVRNDDGWAEPESIHHGLAGDAPSLRLAVAHPYTERTADVIGGQPSGQLDGPLPDHFVTGMTGKEKLVEAIVDLLGAERAGPGSSVRRQVRILVEALPAYLREATGDGMTRTITEDGRPVASVKVQTKLRLETARPIGTYSDQYHLQWLRNSFAEASGRTTITYSSWHGIKTGLRVPIPIIDIDAGILARREPARHLGIESGANAIHVAAHTYTGGTVGFTIEMQHTVTVQLIDGTGEPGSRTVPSQGLFRMPATDAARLGLPVDRAAVARYDAGRPVLHDDLTVELPDDVLPEPPSWLGSGAGPAMVRGFTGEAGLASEVEGMLLEARLLPRRDQYGFPERPRARHRVPGRDEVARQLGELDWGQQLANLDAVTAVLSATRMEGGYDQLAGEGVEVTLVRRRHAGPAQRYTLHVGLQQADRSHWQFVGVSSSWKPLYLDIANGWIAPTGGGAVTGTSGQFWLRSVKERAATAGSSWAGGHTINSVTLVEFPGPVAVFRVPHELQAALVAPDGTTVARHEQSGEAFLIMPVELLPTRSMPTAALVTEHTAPDLLAGSSPLYLRLSDRLAGLERVLPNIAEPGDNSRQYATSFLGIRALMANPELFATAYPTDVVVDPQGDVVRRGSLPRRGELSVRGELGASRVVAVVSDGITADINLTMHRHQSGASHQETGGMVLSAEVGMGGVGVTGAGVGGQSHSLTDVYGREHLTVSRGQKYVVATRFTLDVTGVEHPADPHITRLTRRGAGGTPETASIEGEWVHLVSEPVMFRHYGARTLDLPPEWVGNALDRYATRDLDLDYRTVAAVITRYRADVGADPDRVVADAERRLAEDQAQDAERGPLPEPLPGIGQSDLEDIVLTGADGTPVTLLDVVQRLVAEKVAAKRPTRPAGQIPAVAGGLYNDLAGTRWRGNVEDMLSPRGAVMSVPAPVGGSWSKGTQWLTVRITASLRGATPLGPANDVTLVLQDYVITEEGQGSFTGRRLAIGGGAGIQRGGGDVGTDTDLLWSDQVAREVTRLQHLQSSGARRVARELTLTVEVVRSRVDLARRLVGPEANRDYPVPDPEPVSEVLKGEVVQLVPVRDSAEPGSLAVEQLPDPRPVQLRPPFVVEHVDSVQDGEDMLFVAIREAVVELWGEEAAQAAESQLDAQLSVIANQAFLERATGRGGAAEIRVTYPGEPREQLVVGVEASLTNLRVLARGLPDLKFGQVDRSQVTSSRELDTGLLAPRAKKARVVVRGGSVAQGSVEHYRHRSAVRDEATIIEAGSGAELTMRVHYGLTFKTERVEFEVEQKALTLTARPTELMRRYAASGQARVIVPDANLDAMRSQQESPDPGVPGWLDDDQRSQIAARERWWWRRQRLAGSAGAVPSVDFADLLDAVERMPADQNALRDRLAALDVAGAPVVRLSAPDPGLLAALAPETVAQLMALELDTTVLIEVRSAGDRGYRFRAVPGEGLASEFPDDGYAVAVSALPPDLARDAYRLQVDLYHVFRDRQDLPPDQRPTFVAMVRAEVGRRQ